MKILWITAPREGEVTEFSAPNIVSYDMFHYPPLGLLAIAAEVDPRHELKVLDTVTKDMTLQESVNYIVEFNPDLLGISLVSRRLYPATAIFKQVKELMPDLITVAGGPHINDFAVETMNFGCIDYALAGFCERTFPKLIETLDQDEVPESDFQNIPNLYYFFEDDLRSTPPSTEPVILDDLPYPKRELVNLRDYFTAVDKEQMTTLYTSRGCPYKCTFCEIPSYMDMYETNKFYYRSAENIIAEVDALKEQGIQPNLLLFVDSTFNLNLKWTVDFFEKYKEHIDIPFSCNIVAGMINEKLVEALGNTKLCQSIRFAVEVGNERLRKEVLGKKVSNEKMVWAANALKKKNIPLYVYLMFAVPYDSVENTLETIHLTQKLKPDFVNSSIFSPYRGLAITDKALEGGYLTEDDINRLDDPEFSRLGSVLRLPEKNAIVNIHSLSLAMIHFPRTERILGKFIHSKNNFLFKLFFLVSHFLQTRRFVDIGVFRSIYEGYHHRLES